MPIKPIQNTLKPVHFDERVNMPAGVLCDIHPSICNECEITNQ